MAIITKLPDVQNNFPEDLLKEIKKSNSEKTSDAPRALFLFSAYDSEKLFNEIPAHFFILNIAKTHRVAIQIIQKNDQIKSAIKSEGKSQPIDLLVFNAHGEDKYMRLSENEVYSVIDVNRSDFDRLSPHAEILLASCKTGNRLAQIIADITGHTVFAPKDKISFLQTSFTFCKNHNLSEMRSYNTKHQPIAFRFQEGKPSVLCNEDEHSSTYFSDLREFLINKSKQGNSNAQINLGALEEQAGNTEVAKTLYRQAADKGHAKAQSKLGYMEEQAGNTEVAKTLYRQAAGQGDSSAQFNLGILEEQADNTEVAKTLYQQAAEQGHAKAQFNLGLLYHKERNFDAAKKWYQQAAEQGHAKAQFKLALLYDKEGNRAKAIEWYQQAAEQGYEKAKVNLEFIEKKENVTPSKRKLQPDWCQLM